jgi:predicted nuclease of predicted toxin-antitoxin system
LRLLLDSCLSPIDAEALRATGHDVVWTRERGRDPGDSEILRWAFHESRIVVTLDGDFAQLVHGRTIQHGGVIWLRNIDPADYVDRTLGAIEMFHSELDAGRLVVVTKTKTRISPIRTS